MAEKSRGGDAEPNGKPKKRIVICADGTWNDPEEEHPTNVLRMARAIRPEDPRGVQQVVFYDWGVGSYHARIRGAVAGLGLKKNIQDCYRFIVQNYDKDDELFLFGFSRGAYTVRALAGLLNKCGILGRDRADEIPDAFRFYKCRGSMPDGESAKRWRECHGVEDRGVVHFLGAWDTVGALGVPNRVLAFVDQDDLFYDQELGSTVQVARHAVAIDEKRADFSPTLWTAKESVDIKQVWFAGVHSDIGGGSGPKNGKLLSDVPLAWMAAEAWKQGLALEPHLYCDPRSLYTAERHRSYNVFWMVRGREARIVPKDGLVHESVCKRREARKREGRKYAPRALREWLGEQSRKTEPDEFPLPSDLPQPPERSGRYAGGGGVPGNSE